jgi:predicted phage tail protein
LYERAATTFKGGPDLRRQSVTQIGAMLILGGYEQILVRKTRAKKMAPPGARPKSIG